MLKRVTGELFRAKAGDRVRIRAVATNNPGSNIASFEYADAIVANDAGSTSQCTFDVVSGIKQFQAVVVFAPGAGATAQYDLFELDNSGVPQPLDESVTPDASPHLIGFGIQGTGVGIAAAPPPGLGLPGGPAMAPPPPPSPPLRTPRPMGAEKKAAKRAAKKAAKKTAARKGVAKKAVARKTAKKTARKTARKAATKTATRRVAKRAPKRVAKRPSKRAARKKARSR